MEKTLAFAYLRVSSTLQVGKGGFSRQLKACQIASSERKYNLVGIYYEKGISGVRDGLTRPAFTQMIADMLESGVRTILIESLDRLARELMVQEQILMYLIGKGFDLVSANTGEIVTEAIQADPMKKAMIRMQAIFHELDKCQTVMRLRRGREKVRLAKGYCEGRMYYAEDCDVEKAVVRRMQRMRALKRGSTRRMSYAKIADALNTEHIPTKSNKLWTAMAVSNTLNLKRKKKVKTRR